MLKLIAAIALAGSAALAALAAVDHEPRASAALAAASSTPPGRIAVNREQLREAYSAGLLDRPVKTFLDVREPMTYGEFRWDERGVPPGRAWVRIDLKSQILSIFRSGHEIGTAVILYGTDGLPTPTGKFPVLAKLKDHRSRTYGNAPMPYTLLLTRDGVAIHGSNVRWGFATHGCVGVPTAFAAKLFGALNVGDQVLIVSGKSRAHKD